MNHNTIKPRKTLFLQESPQVYAKYLNSLTIFPLPILLGIINIYKFLLYHPLHTATCTHTHRKEIEIFNELKFLITVYKHFT